MPMFFIQFEGTPRQGCPEDKECGGAYINCYIERPNSEEALKVARQMIDENNWIVGDPDEIKPVGDDYFPADSTGRKYYEQAKIDKEVIVYHTYPVVDEEE